VKVELERTFAMPASPDVVWTLLQDVEAVAACMPGARITDRLPGGSYKGTVSVKVGPAAMSFRGEIEMRDVDAAQRSLRLLGKGTDSTGTSGASMDLAARVEAVGDGTSNLIGKSVVAMNGRAAGFGARMMDSVADQVLKQFAQNMAAQVAVRTAAPATTTPADVTPAPPPARELDGLALLWAALKQWMGSLFRRKSA
jgi:carbon monoxide dehydrogenase subunit G